MNLPIDEPVAIDSSFSMSRKGRIHQLRIYELFEKNKSAFLSRFRNDVVRIMRRHNFRITQMWEAASDDRHEFVYVLEWPDTDTMATAWNAFLADDEWKGIKLRSAAEHGEMVGSISNRTLVAFDSL